MMYLLIIQRYVIFTNPNRARNYRIETHHHPRHPSPTMKIVLLFLSLVLLAKASINIGQVCTHAGGPPSGGSCITIFDDSVFANMGTNPVGSNQASYLILTLDGYYVDVYDDINYAGATKRYRSTITRNNLNDDNWNDKISSIKITPVVPNAPGLALWKNSNFGSQYQYFDAGNVLDISVTGFPNSAASSSFQFPYTEAYMFQNTGGIAQCSPPSLCAIYWVTSTTTAMAFSSLSPNDKAKSLYVAAFNTPTTTTAVVSTTQAVTTTQAAATTTQAITTTTAATTQAITTTTAATTTAHAAVTTSVALLTLQAAGPIGGAAHRDRSNGKSGGTGNGHI